MALIVFVHEHEHENDKALKGNRLKAVVLTLNWDNSSTHSIFPGWHGCRLPGPSAPGTAQSSVQGGIYSVSWKTATVPTPAPGYRAVKENIDNS